MTSFSLLMQKAFTGLIVCVIVYTLWLVISKRLNASEAIKCLLAECAALAAVLFGKRLSQMANFPISDSKKLIVVIATIILGLASFFLLELFRRISSISLQVKRLNLEVALLRGGTQADEAMQSVHPIADPGSGRTYFELSSKDMMLALWILGCIFFYLLDIKGLPSFLAWFFTANYMQ